MFFEENLFEVNKIDYRYDAHPLFSELSFTLKSGDLLLITGNNGCGKSTLLRLLTGLMLPLKGNILWNNTPIHTDQNKRYHANMHYISHQNGLKAALSVQENIELMLALHHTPTPKHLPHLLEQLSLHALLHAPLHHLSAGQKRRVALLRLLLIKRPLWILDEPLTALDTNTQLLLQTLISAHQENRGMVIMSSHHALDQLQTPYHQLKMTA